MTMSNGRDIGAIVDPREALHQDDWDGAGNLDGDYIDINPDGNQQYESALLVIRLRDGAADEDVDFILRQTNDKSAHETLKDIGKVTYDQSAGGTDVYVKVDLETAKRYLQLRAQDEASSDTDVGNADLSIHAELILGGAHELPIR